jgi:hypothetical protein
MNKLWVFGDSFSHGHGFHESDPFYKITLPDTVDSRYWGQIVANELGLELMNCSKVGASNDWILDLLLEDSNNISENDYVVIQSTYFSRFDVPHDNKFNFLHTIFKHQDDNDDIKINLVGDDNITDRKKEVILDYVIHFANLPAYEYRQLNRFHKVIQLLKTKNVAFWCIRKPKEFYIDEIDIIKEPYFIKFDNEYIGAEDSFETYRCKIYEETDWKINDGHIGVLGQQVMAHEVLKKFNSEYPDKRK